MRRSTNCAGRNGVEGIRARLSQRPRVSHALASGALAALRRSGTSNKVRKSRGTAFGRWKNYRFCDSAFDHSQGFGCYAHRAPLLAIVRIVTQFLLPLEYG